MDDDVYLIWSHEHGAWWGPDYSGYVSSVSQAGRYPRVEALAICADGMPGTSTRLGALPELPVSLADVDAMIAFYNAKFPDRPAMTITTELYQAVIALNAAIDAYWNDDERGLGLTGMGEHHMVRITEAQRRCREALEAEEMQP